MPWTSVSPQCLPDLCVNVHAGVGGGLVDESLVPCVAEQLDLAAALSELAAMYVARHQSWQVLEDHSMSMAVRGRHF